jgi:hypothetical protein
MICAVCFGDPSSPLTQGYNYGIIAMLLVVFAVLACFGTLFLNIRNRIKKQTS